MPTVLHVLPHRGGGAETYIDLLEEIDGYSHERVALSASRSPLAAAPSIALNWPRVWRRARRADLVHVHGDVAAMLCVPMLRRRRAVVTTHGLHFVRRARGARLAAARAGLRAVAASARRVVCTSHAERDELAAIVGPDAVGRLSVIPNAVSLPPEPPPGERAAARAELGLRDGDVAALYMGQLEARKDPLTAVAAAERARAQGQPVVLLVAGEGPLEPDVRAHAGDAVRPLGLRPDPQRLLAAVDVFVLPSRREGMSMALLEAMAAGRAVVVSDGPGNPETVGSAGLVTPVGDADALAARLAELAADERARARLGAAARARVAGEFAAERFVARMRALYDEVLAPGA
jgi:glycosyltransferase involved in cell wall biosynthesis